MTGLKMEAGDIGGSGFGFIQGEKLLFLCGAGVLGKYLMYWGEWRRKRGRFILNLREKVKCVASKQSIFLCGKNQCTNH